MGSCSCENLDGQKPRKCDACLIDEMRGLGLDPVSAGYRQSTKQRVRVVRVKCPDCREERDIIPGNARRGLGMRCLPCLHKSQIGKPKIIGRRVCKDCGETYRPTCSTQYRCDKCIVRGLRQMGHDVIGLRREAGRLKAVCRCPGCRVRKPVDEYDLRRTRMNVPWRCALCSRRRVLTTYLKSA